MRINNKEARLRVFATPKGNVSLIPGWNEDVNDEAWAEAKKTRTVNGLGKEIGMVQTLIDEGLLEEGGASASTSNPDTAPILPTQVAGNEPVSGKSASDNPNGGFGGTTPLAPSGPEVVTAPAPSKTDAPPSRGSSPGPEFPSRRK